MALPGTYGQGMSFPPRIGADGRIAWSVDEDNIRESIRIILLTEPGERLMRETFGVGLREFLFEPNTATTRQLIVERISRVVAMLELRVNVTSVSADPVPGQPRLIAISISFSMIATQATGQIGLTMQLEG